MASFNDVQIKGNLDIVGSVQGGGTTPVGTVIMFAGNLIPKNYLLCDGSRFSATEYAELYAVLGTDITPDLRGRFVLGAGQSTYDANKTFNIGAKGGIEKHILSESELASHTHTQQPHTHDCQTHIGWQSGGGNAVGKVTANNGDANGWGTTIYETTAINNSTGSNAPHENMPPYYVLRYLIRCK